MDELHDMYSESRAAMEHVEAKTDVVAEVEAVEEKAE